MKLANRVSKISESVTLKLNAKAVEMKKTGRKVFNLTAGQLPFRPMPEFVNLIRSESDFLHSFQYSPVAGLPDLRAKFVSHFEKTRGIKVNDSKHGCIVSNGGKHAISNIFACLLEEGDEAVFMAPYWVSYPEMVSLYGAKSVIVETGSFDVFVPSLDKVKESINKNTKLIVLNSPNNPSGTHYSEEWMKGFAEILKDFPDVYVVSDEIYYELYYYDPKPTYFYQYDESLFERTIIVDGISKTLASTGLRIGFTIAPTKLFNAINKLQGQTASGANSLVQRALCHFNFDNITTFLTPIKKHLRDNAEILGESFRKYNMSHLWYQPKSAFYYLIDFSSAPIKEKYSKLDDASVEICEELLETHGIALVPGAAFGCPNTARISLVSEKEVFAEASDILLKYMACQ